MLSKKKGYPLREEVFEIDNHVRHKYPSVINLSSCELNHPKLDEFFATLKRYTHDAVRTYPFPSETKYHIHKHWRITEETITLSAGSDPIISILVEALGTNTGRMILQSPNYFGWHDYALLRNLKIIAVPFGSPTKHQFSCNALLEAIRSNAPSLVVISNPNNLTGSLLPVEQVSALADECEAHNHLLIIDECFAGFSEIDHFKTIGPKDHVIYVRSFSKCLGLAGARLSLTIASPKITQYISRWRPEAAVSGLALEIFSQIIERESLIRNICKEINLVRDEFIRAVKEIKPSWQALPANANYVTFFVNQDDAATIKIELQNQGFLIKDLSAQHGLINCIRIGIAHTAIMTGVIAAIKLLA